MAMRNDLVAADKLKDSPEPNGFNRNHAYCQQVSDIQYSKLRGGPWLERQAGVLPNVTLAYHSK